VADVVAAAREPGAAEIVVLVRSLHAAIKRAALITASNLGTDQACLGHWNMSRAGRGYPGELSSLLTMRRISYDDAGQPVEYGPHVYPAERYSFEMSVVSDSTT